MKVHVKLPKEIAEFIRNLEADTKIKAETLSHQLDEVTTQLRRGVSISLGPLGFKPIFGPSLSIDFNTGQATWEDPEALIEKKV
jgi:hypothetical protein